MLGDFRLIRDNEPVMIVDSVRLQSLLTYLALHRGAPQSRAHLASLFWPDSTEKQSLTNLRHLLHELRKVLPEADDFIQIENRSLFWKPGAEVTLDVSEFEKARVESDEAMRRGDNAGLRKTLERAARLYEGDLLLVCTQEWIVPDRERLRHEYAVVLQRWVRVLEDARDYVAALTQARRLQQLEPTHEATYCTMMRLHMLAGDRAAAFQVYRDCVEVLRRELAVGPGKIVREMYDRLLSGASLEEPAPGHAASSGRTELPLHGRNAEWLRLRNTWSDAARGRAQAVIILGEAGIGKSRLAEELCVWFERQGGAAARSRSYAAEGRLAFAPAAEWLRAPALQAHLAKLDVIWLAEVAHILPELRQRHRTLPEAEAGQESWQRHRLFEALSRALLAGQVPVLLLLDDMQWTDLETLEWLRFLLRFAPGAPLLVLGTIRTEELGPDHALQRFLLDLRRDGQVTEIQLGPLSAPDAARVAADVAERPLHGDEAAWLYRETEGNPLFVVESVRAGIRNRDSAAVEQPLAGATPLPPKVHAVITTRLAQLSPQAREVAAVAAVIGRAFTFEVLAGVCGRPEDDLVPAVDELWQRRILREPETGAYDFTHDKLREVTYAQISAARRRVLHRRTAEVLEQLHAPDPAPVWAQVAAHFEAAGRPVQALEDYRRAAEAAKRVHANEEAIRLFHKALTLVETLPPSRERSAQALELNTALGVCLVAAHGYPDSSVMGIYERAIALCRELGRPTEAPILRALAIASLTIGNTRRAEVLGHDLLSLHAREGDPVAKVEGHYVLGVSCFWMARFLESRVNLEESIARFDPRLRETHLSLYAQDPKAVCLCRLAWTLCFLGFPEQARVKLDEALALARELQHPHTEGYVLCIGAMACLDLRDEARAVELLDALEQLTAKHTLFFWANRGRIMHCLLRAQRHGDPRDLEQAEEHMATYARVGDLVNFSQFLALKARVHLARGAIRAGLAAVDEAFAQLERVDERYYNPELHRLRGELLKAEGSDAGQIEASFTEALRLSREQAAKTCELRAAMSLGRLWQGQRRTGPARELLAATYAWFSEGFETADLREARTLLEQWQ